MNPSTFAVMSQSPLLAQETADATAPAATVLPPARTYRFFYFLNCLAFKIFI